MTAVMALSETETLGTRLMDGVDKLTDHIPNVHIIAGSLNRLGRCITNFGFTLSILFRLAHSVQEALRDLCTSAFRHAATYNFGPADPEAPLVYFYIANRLQYFVASCFRQVLIGATNTREGLVAALRTPFPDVSPYSQFSADIMGIRGAGRRPPCLPVGAPTLRKPSATMAPAPLPAASPQAPLAPPSPTPTPATAVAPTPAAVRSPPPKSSSGKLPPNLSTPRRKQLCGFFNTAEGCTKSDTECRHDHRDAISKGDRDYMKQFFKRFPDRHPK